MVSRTSLTRWLALASTALAGCPSVDHLKGGSSDDGGLAALDGAPHQVGPRGGGGAPGDAGGSLRGDGSSTRPLGDSSVPNGASPSCSTISGTTGRIVDATGDVWTLVVGSDGSLIVDENGAPAGFSDHVTTLAYIGGIISQENSAGAWFGWGSGTWTAEADPTTACGPIEAGAAPDADSGTSREPPAGTITVDVTSSLATISSRELGTGVNIGTDLTDPRVAAALNTVGAKTLRYPGGTWADQFHWQTNTMCGNTPQLGALPISAHGTFDDFMTSIVQPGGLEAVITVDYGTNAACDGGGDPAEAAAWVAYVKSKSYNAHYWTVGNEVYGSYEPDLHNPPDNAATYAAAVSGPNGFYEQMKNADPTAQVGIVLWPGPSDYNGWNATVLGAKTPLDFVEIHPYAQCNNDSDSYLLYSAPLALTAAIEGTRATLTSYGYPASTPIMLGEFNSDGCVQTPQMVSIVNALYAGMAFGELLNDGVAIATWFNGATGYNYELCGNPATGVYGWQDFGDYDAVAVINPIPNCGSGPNVPEGTVFPAGHAEALRSQFAVPGNTMLQTAIGSGLSNVVAYAATRGNGYALMLFNKDEDKATTVSVALNGATRTSFTGTTSTYDKAIYDLTQNNVWNGPNNGSLGTIGTTFDLTLSPWSMTVVLLK